MFANLNCKIGTLHLSLGLSDAETTKREFVVEIMSAKDNWQSCQRFFQSERFAYDKNFIAVSGTI